jgi:hypothetical protein
MSSSAPFRFSTLTNISVTIMKIYSYSEQRYYYSLHMMYIWLGVKFV